MRRESEALLVLAGVCSPGEVDGAALLARFGSAAAVLAAGMGELAAVPGVGPRGAMEIASAAAGSAPVGGLARVDRLGLRILGLGEPAYPAWLAAIDQPPVALFVRGRAELLAGLCVAVVGARRATEYGLATARRFGRELAEAGLVVVSGLARGVDSAAHEGALEAERGGTVAVLGCGAGVVYPPENGALLARIAERGVVVTEYLPGTPPLRRNFPRRNRILSGLARGVVVVEAGERSGSLLTAKHALEQGRDIFAVPGDVDRPLAAGPNGLLREGAIPVRDPGDVLSEYGVPAGRPAAPEPVLSAEESRVFEALERRGVHVDWLAERLSGESISLPLLLANLITKGVARRLPGNRYARLDH